MFAQFFIDRPIFAWVLSLVIILVGSVAEHVLRKAPCPVVTVKSPLPESAEKAEQPPATVQV